MTRVRVVLRADDGRLATLGPGDLIGRMPTCAFVVDDPRISEAHAMVSLRGSELRLLALRGRLSVDGKPRTEQALSKGTRVILAGFFGLEVDAVSLPDRVVSVVEDTGTIVPQPAHGVVSFVGRELRAGFHAEAVAWLWDGPAGMVLRRVGEVDRVVALDERFEVGGLGFTVTWCERTALDASPTLDRGRFEAALRLVLLFDAVHVHGEAGRSAVLDGLSARAVCELHQIGSPVAWTELAALLWPEVPRSQEATLRRRWDQVLIRMRQKLREASLRTDLLRSHGGLVELMLGPRDVVEDLT